MTQFFEHYPQFFKFDQLPEIPFKGSIAHSMIMQIVGNNKL